MRREFPKQVKRDALKRAAKCCEACGVPFGVKFHFDHDIADGLGGEPTLENCKVLCHACHNEKTRKHGHTLDREGKAHQRQAQRHSLDAPEDRQRRLSQGSTTENCEPPDCAPQ